MIKIWYNPSIQAYEVYLNGTKAQGILSIKPETTNDFTNMPRANIIAMVEIVNEEPRKKIKEESTIG